MLEQKKEIREKGNVVGHKPIWRLGQLLGTEKPAELPSADQLRAAFS